MMVSIYRLSNIKILSILTYITPPKGGFLIPMNALLQHRGHQLMGSGHSIAVQNLNENIAILMMLGIYASMIKLGFSVNHIVIFFGVFISLTMGWVTKKHSK